MDFGGGGGDGGGLQYHMWQEIQKKNIYSFQYGTSDALTTLPGEQL